MDITDIDPVEYGLTFERFLNPERVQMPDVDMDFEDTRRAEVIDYVTKKYSPNQDDPTQARVAQIITFGTLAARAVLKDAGKALGYPAGDVDKLCKMIPTIPVGMTIDKTMDANPEFKNAYVRDPAARKLIDTAKRLEGISRHASVHAAGVIISHNPLVEYTPLTRECRRRLCDAVQREHAGKNGLLKMDFLGLINLTILGPGAQKCGADDRQKTGCTHPPARRRRRGRAQNLRIAWQRRVRGRVPTGIAADAQVHSGVEADQCAQRGGYGGFVSAQPMARISRFVRCKHGLEKIEYPHEKLKELLDETYGVIVYQDQVMQIAQIISGYTLGQADLLRRAMGKKKKEVMVQERENFLRGARENGVSEKKANEIFDLMEPFAGYAFNKAHAVCYAMVAYQTAYLKANYPVEYMSALLACFIEKSDKLVTCMDECKRMGIPVLPPDINSSEADFTVEKVSRSIRGSGRRGET